MTSRGLPSPLGVVTLQEGLMLPLHGRVSPSKSWSSFRRDGLSRVLHPLLPMFLVLAQSSCGRGEDPHAAASRDALSLDDSDQDPLHGIFGLSSALVGVEGEGPLMARITTSEGDMLAQLFEAEVPRTVANFVGLVRGVRPFRDPHTRAWIRRPFYDGLLFHRVVQDFAIQTGCPIGDGRGGPGYLFDDEPRADLRHDRPGVLAMARAGPNTNGSQFFITAREAPHLDGRFTVFGLLVDGHEVLKRISNVRTDATRRPISPVAVQKISVFRGSWRGK